MIPRPTARRLLLGAQGLLDDPTRPATTGSVRTAVTALGFVQLDSINVLARAHDLALASRLDDYKPAMLDALLASRDVFEHWTHDASVIPTIWYAHWKPRFRRDAARLRERAWWTGQLGKNGDAMLAHVRERVTKEGPLESSDFEHTEKKPGSGWWNWKPQKAALDYLWRTGELAVRERVHFRKVYDLTERVLPRVHACDEPDEAEHVAWACETAAERLVVFTPRELAAFWNAISVTDAARWCAAARLEGRLVSVHVDGVEALALEDWRWRANDVREAAEASTRMRLLSPFDPVLRDRARAERLFGFHYRFEAFTPKKKRVHGYYTMPVLDTDELVARVDPSFDRDRGVLVVRGPWWEPGVRPTRAQQRRLDEALARLATFLGADRISRVSRRE